MKYKFRVYLIGFIDRIIQNSIKNGGLLLKFIFWGGLLLFNSTAFAQSDKSEFIKIADPSVGSFIKFVDFPVDMFTGSADVSIPLYTLIDGSISIPITLRYNTSGIKVNEEASYVGLGWNLNLGGIITQTAIGKIDNEQNYSQFLSKNMWPEKSTTLTPLLKYNSQNGCFNGQTICSGEYEEMDKIIATEYMPDVYYYSFLGYSGKFVIDPQDNKIHLINSNQNIKFEKSGDVWKAITEDGMQFLFGKSGDIWESGSRIGKNSYLEAIIYPNGQTVSFSYQSENYYSQPTTSSKKRIIKGANVASESMITNSSVYEMENTFCTGLETQNLKVKFNTIADRADLAPVSASSKANRLESIIVVNKKDTSYNRKFKFYTSYFTTPSPYGNYASMISDVLIKRLKLDSVLEVGKQNLCYKFKYNQTPLPVKTTYAQDYWGYYNGKTENSTLIPNYFYLNVKGVDMGTTTKTAGANRAYDSTFCKAGILESITYPTGGRVEYKYEPHTFSGQIVPTTSEIDKLFNQPYTDFSSIQDLNWTSGDKLSVNIPFTQTKKVRIKVVFSRGSYTWSELAGANVTLSAYEFGSKTWVPNQSSTENSQTFYEYFDMVPTRYNYSFSVNMPDPKSLGLGQASATAVLAYPPDTAELANRQYSFGAGLRVKDITAYDKNNVPILKTSYKYDDIPNGKIYGELAIPLLFHHDIFSIRYKFCLAGEDNQPLNTVPSYREFYQDETILSSSNVYYFPYSCPNGYVGYSKVIQNSENPSNSNAQNEVGSLINEYNVNAIQVMPDKGVPGYTTPYYGTLKKSTYLDNSNTVKKIVEIESKDTLLNVARGAYGDNRLNTMSESMLDRSPCLPDDELGLNTHTRLYYLYLNYYPILSIRMLQTKKTTTTDGVTEVENYGYNSLGQLTSQIITNSDEVVNKKIYYHIGDYSGADRVLIEMKENNWIDPLWKKEEYLNDKLIYKEEDSYSSWYYSFYRKNWYNLTKRKIYPSGGDNGSYLTQFDYQIDLLNSISNIGMIQKENDNPISYFWGYNGTNPVIKAENITMDNLNILVLGALNGTGYSSLDTLLKNINGFPNAAWLTFNKNLRTNAPKALIATYTYIPLIGMTSQTDPNGLTTYYEYDEFGRLKYVRDNEGNILKTYDYNYKQ